MNSTLTQPFGRLGPVQLRQLLESRGPVFIKIGQHLALRPDLLPQEYCDELIKLLDRVPPFSWPQAQAILTEELGRDPAKVFAFIDPTPVAAGSLAQVHRALLPDGTEVAVKIQRPNIAEVVRRELKQPRLLVRLLNRTQITLVVPPRELLRELADWMDQELDFRRELANLSRLYGLAKESPLVRIPRPYPELCTSRVITATFLRGTPLSELLRAVHPGANEEPRPVDAVGIEFGTFARNLVTSTLEQAFRHRFFHADLHPGNLLLLPGNVVGYVDFGLCDELDATVRASQLRYLSAVYNDDRGAIFRAMTEILVPSAETDFEAFRRDFEASTRQSEGPRNGDGRDHPNGRSPFAHYLIGLMRSARRNQLQVPTRVLSLYRAILTVETIVQQLGEGDVLVQTARTFFRRLQLDALVDRASDPVGWVPQIVSLLDLAQNGPRHLEQILTEVADGSFTLRVYVTEASRTARARNQRARLVTAAILSVSAVLLLVQDLPRVLGVSLAWPISAALVFLLLVVGYFWRRLE